MQIPSHIHSFIQHFGEMGSRWGFNRTVSQICALLVISEEPLNADQISEHLSISRSNVSMGIKELQSWNLLRMISIPGDRKDYFTTSDDIWELARTLIEERRKREVDPTLSMLRGLLLQRDDTQENDYAINRMQEMHDLIELFVSWFTDMQSLNSKRLKKLMKLGSGVNKVLDMTDKLAGKTS
ncbi:GbsR/MarR family transcriptional regulator [Kangiella sp. HZ709]|uniref:GbsR/MarR family transcriptional regulator n=1 Tax=Kangiella sp. HZ709 TaxID=2666328 RepID=UPI0012AF3A33|nr:GbsR/MarR family transcriptional regulator [Kangiella sp. HZ709]MRX26826.1 HTH domain-containing protein [Kangiella sp. HZ709]